MIKVALPSHGDLVDEHFGHCEAFTIFTVNDGGVITDQARMTPPPACGCKSNLISTLSDMGVSVLLAGGMGEGAVRLLKQSGITVVRGASGPLRPALQSWIDGHLHDNDEVCHAHGPEGCGSH